MGQQTGSETLNQVLMKGEARVVYRRRRKMQMKLSIVRDFPLT